MIDNFDQLYICHYTPLTERFDYMNNQCKKYNIQEKLLFITEYDREKLSENDTVYFDKNKLKMCEISLFLKHIKAMKNIIDSKKEYGIIMEDDVIFKDNFINNFNELTKTFPETFDIIYTGVFPFYKEYKNYSKCENPIFKSNNTIGNLCNMDNITVFPWTGNNKGTDFYIISKKACIKFILFIEKIKKNKNKIESPIDHFMGLFFYNNGNVFWSNKEITLHGSCCNYVTNGIFNNSMKDQRGH
tara:strand:- start:3377 stop:4108 length:732 start_codon:yes stop_codon:yes gene_type:complete